MRLDDALYNDFLQQMQELENFRMTYASAHPEVPMDRDDPDVKRLVEAMAFFSARTHRAGLRNIDGAQLRMFRQCFPYLLAPLPAMTMLKAAPGGGFAETVVIPAGCEFQLTPAGGPGAIFRTLHDLTLRPLSMDRVSMPLTPGRGYRLLLEMAAPYHRSEAVGDLSLHINHLNNYKASLQVFHTLRRHIRSASVFYDAAVGEESVGAPAELSWGLPEPEEEWRNPLLKERFFFHFPRQELFLNVHFPPPPATWRKLTVCFDLDAGWPSNLILSRDIFHLHTVPAMNLKRAMAQPILCDGTKEEHPIRYPDTAGGFQPQFVTGVYRVEEGGMVPMRPGILSGASGTYEIRQEPAPGGGTEYCLLLNFPEAVAASRAIAIEVYWLQRGFSGAAGRRLSIMPYNREIAGVSWESLGDVVPHADNGLGELRDIFLNLFTLKNKPELDLDDLYAILQAMGNVLDGEFLAVANLLTGIRVEQALPRKGEREGTLRKIYTLRFSKLDPAFEPQAETFLAHVGRILDGWQPEAVIETRMEAAAPSPAPAGQPKESR